MSYCTCALGKIWWFLIWRLALRPPNRQIKTTGKISHYTVFCLETAAITCIYITMYNYNIMCTLSVSFLSYFISGDPWFHGTQFVHPAEIECIPSRLFYKQEVFSRNKMDLYSMRNITGHCTVMSLEDFRKSKYSFLICDEIFFRQQERFCIKCLLMYAVLYRTLCVPH